MAEASFTHFLQQLLAGMRTRGDDLVLCEKQGSLFHTLTLRETAAHLADFARSLSAAKIEPGDRVAFSALASSRLLMGEWATLAIKAIAVIIPNAFSTQELIETLVESKSKLVIVNTLATAKDLVAHANILPDLRYILCLESSAQGQIPILSWKDFIDSGRREPDRSTALLRSITEKDTAFMFFYRDEQGQRQALRYTHALLLKHIALVRSLLGQVAIQKRESVLTATAWENALEHIAAYYAPIASEAFIQIIQNTPDLSLFENSPQVVIGKTPFFDALQRQIIEQIHHAGKVESKMLATALSLSKQRYELPKNLSGISRLLWSILHVTIVKKMQKMLGGKMRLFICMDDNMNYDSELFFNMLDIKLVELPQDMFK